MARKSTDDTLAALKRRQDEIAQQIKEKERVKREQEKEREGKMLEAYGLYVRDELLKTGELTEDELKAKLDRILRLNTHRAAIGLELIGIAGKNKKERNQDHDLHQGSNGNAGHSIIADSSVDAPAAGPTRQEDHKRRGRKKSLVLPSDDKATLPESSEDLAAHFSSHN